MPELPEVETTKQGIEPFVVNQVIDKIIVRNPSLRWPVPQSMSCFEGMVIKSLERRSKYLIFHAASGGFLIHLGMSGSLRICSADAEIEKHDHIDLVFNTGDIVRYRDPRRFGCCLPFEQDTIHPLLKNLGPEPLSDDFHADYLHQRLSNKKAAIKTVIMDAKIVVGVGNIYASEALFLAGISPKRQAGSISLESVTQLVAAIKSVLEASIKQGGTTLKDFVRENGESGYFQLHLNVYGRGGENCFRCDSPIVQFKQGQRSSFYCPTCQH